MSGFSLRVGIALVGTFLLVRDSKDENGHFVLQVVTLCGMTLDLGVSCVSWIGVVGLPEMPKADADGTKSIVKNESKIISFHLGTIIISSWILILRPQRA